jgi:hypothetical protein
MKSIFKNIGKLILAIILTVSCNESVSNSLDDCTKAREHISLCMVKITNHLIYFENWESYCKAETPEKILSMDCKKIKKEFFGY